MPKPKLLAIDMGTFCDFKFMENSIVKLTNKFDIVYVTDKKRNLPSWVSARYDFLTPDDVTSNIHLNILDHQQQILSWIISNPYRATSQYLWTRHMSKLVEKACKEHEISGILLHWTVIFLLWFLNPKILEQPLFVLYYGPALINKKSPYIFDHTLKNPSFELYTKSKDYDVLIRKTWEVSYNKLSYGIVKNMFDLRRDLGKVQHVLCYDREITPVFEPSFPSHFVKIHTLGSIYNEKPLDAKRWYNPKKSSERSPPESLTTFMKLKSPMVMMSFGSYSTNDLLFTLLPFIVKAVIDCGFKILFHSPTESKKLIGILEPYSNIYLQEGWLPYEWAVPHCGFVIFTGSVCLQTICLYNQCPMIFVPLLAEQFFWARNYQYMTGTSHTSSTAGIQTGGVPFVSYIEPPSTQIPNLIRALLGEFPGVHSYLARVAASMRKYDGKSMLYDLVTSQV